MAQNVSSSKRKTIPENADEIFFLLPTPMNEQHPRPWRLLGAQLLTQHCGHFEEEAENTILALRESLSWYWVETNLIL